ncbi:3-hydroxyacyl-ACP dehydratase [Chitinophaga sp. CB10]|uniref:3-hydroxyacyl-ACP dehydratase n=1 Tax=Chitinophaga sp. CB10 TaxID=1891659 RepID=UPI0025BF0A58|nr:3-hydroxyacyl-ACP dehydratase [Chitinophaga sp. CB10]
MLAGNFYTITEQTQEGGQLNATIALNAEHPVFGGHFPEQPVVPGVCMMQTITEFVRTVANRKVMLQKANQMKFMNMIDPRQTPLVDVQVTCKEEDAALKVTAVLKREDKTFMKFQGLFK